MPRKKEEVSDAIATAKPPSVVVGPIPVPEQQPDQSHKCVLVPQADFISEQLPKIPSDVLCAVLGLKDLTMHAMTDRDTMVELIDGQFSRVIRPNYKSSPPPPPPGDEDD